jgi:hypothetical protein
VRLWSRARTIDDGPGAPRHHRLVVSSFVTVDGVLTYEPVGTEGAAGAER